VLLSIVKGKVVACPPARDTPLAHFRAVAGPASGIISQQSPGSPRRQHARVCNGRCLECDICCDTPGGVIDGDRAVVVFTFTGTHTGLLFGMQGSGETLVFRGVSVYKVADGQIVHEQRIFDFTGFLMNLGIITARPAGDR